MEEGAEPSTNNQLSAGPQLCLTGLPRALGLGPARPLLPLRGIAEAPLSAGKRLPKGTLALELGACFAG